MKKNILIISGEPSGDIRGAELVKALKNLLPEYSFWGIGGDSLEKENVTLIDNIKNLSIIGVGQVIRKLPLIRKQFQNILDESAKRKPDLAILIDYPGFNLRLAKKLKSQGIPVIYYIIPQVWAWGKNRVNILKKYVDMSLVLFDFEKEFLLKHGASCTFVGHPILDSVPSLDYTEGSSDKKNIISLLPGSRKHEILRLLPLMLESARKISIKIPDVKFLLAKSSSVNPDLYETIMSNYKDVSITSFTDDTFTVLGKSDICIIASGTATLEAALMETPMVITYKSSFLTFLLFHIFVRLKYVGLANIACGEQVAPEFMQFSATSKNISNKVCSLLSDKLLLEEMRFKLKKAKLKLGEKGAAHRAALEIKNFIGGE